MPIPTTAIIVIPAYEPTKNFLRVFTSLRLATDRKVVVVDDGSGSQYQDIFDQLSDAGAEVLQYSENRGKGFALKTAIKYVREKYPNAAGIVTADSDGQHATQDILTIASDLEGEPDNFILGIRNFSRGAVPPKSYWGNTITSKMTKIATGFDIPDTQTGLRGLPAESFDWLINLAGDRFEYEMNMLLELKEQPFQLKMIPIETIYENNNAGTHFHPIRDSLLVYRRFIKFAMSSFGSAIVDVALFAVFLKIGLGTTGAISLLMASVAARILSGVFNYSVNHHWVFKSNAEHAASGTKYLSLFLIQLVLSAGLLQLVEIFIPHPVSLKIIIDVLIFFGSYLIQKKLVFKEATPQHG
jgi:glycosyltransferase involved in cell wall biosynthesis